MKLINDTVHGYINLPDEYFREFIDTEIFQRLRRIEQTSIRTIFPCAHHDRFIHSIGTYYLGNKAITTIINNWSDGEIRELGGKRQVTNLKQSFEIACLLHDCGHAPFSHNLEYLYGKANNLDALLIENATDKAALVTDLKGNTAKEHEKVSAYLVLKYYKDNIHRINKSIDIELIARMIIGCKYKPSPDVRVQVKNELINLLNGKAIDVDKLDYAARDRWASGYKSTSVDLERLISAFRITKISSHLHFCIHKSALSEIEGVLDSRNFQYVWIISHHKVVYDQIIFENAIKKMANTINPEDSIDVLKKIFNINMFFAPQQIYGNNIYQLSDDDIIYLLKKYREDNDYAKEWFSRQHRLRPLWKSYAEYFSLIAGKCSGTNIDKPEYILAKTDEAVRDILRTKGIDENNYLLKSVMPKISRIAENELYIQINGSITSYSNLGLIDKYKDKIKPFIYLYLPEPICKNLKDDICSAIIENIG